MWVVLLTGILALPYALQSPSLGDDLIRNTIRVSLLYYAAAVALMTYLQPGEWTAQSTRGATARLFWTLAWVAFLVHLVMAFHHAHHWSHAAAVQHTEDVSGFGPGIYVSHLFSLVWTADVVFWWCWPLRYARLSPWVDRLLHGFMLFVAFNATVVFEAGLIRWIGLALCVFLAGLWLYRNRREFDPARKEPSIFGDCQ
jgi:hypothetical protein